MKKPSTIEWLLSRSARRRRQRLAFFRSAEFTYRAGISILEFLREVKASPGSQKRIVQLLIDEISGGKTLSEAMSDHLDFFLPRDIHWIRFGERTGRMDRALRSLLIIIGRENENRRVMTGILIYPIVLLVTGFIAISLSRAAQTFGALLWKSDYVPSSGGTYDIFYILRDWDNPLIQEAVRHAFHLGANLLFKGFLILLTIWIFFRFLLPIFLRATRADRVLDFFKMKIPFLNKIYLESGRDRFFLCLAEGSAGGYPWGELIQMASETMENTYYLGETQRAVTALRGGSTLSEAFQNISFINREERLQIQTAEKAGRLDEAFRTFHEDARYNLAHWTAALGKVGKVLAVIVGGGFVLYVVSQIYLSYINWAFDTILG